MNKLDFTKDNGAIRLEDGTEAEWVYRKIGDMAELNITMHYQAAFGMGEKYNGLNQKGNTVVNAVEEKFCFQGEKTYCPVPFFWTDTGFGVYVYTANVTTFHFESEGVRIIFPAGASIVIFTGNPQEIISSYMSLHGPAKLPPKWAFGPWVSANHWDSQKKVYEVLGQLNLHAFPATVIVLEAWSDEATFYIFNGAKYKPEKTKTLEYEDFDFSQSMWPNPRKMIQDMNKAGIHLVLWQIPVYKHDESGVINEQHSLDCYEALEKGLCVHKTDGNVYTIPEGNWFSGSMIPDLTNPDTRAIWFSKRQYLLDIGVEGFKTDGGEFIYDEKTIFADGTKGSSCRNRYAQDYVKSYTDFVGDSRILFSRAGFSGQHTTPMHWAGDQQSVNSELVSALNAGLSAASTGILFWGFDIGGFAGKLPTLDLYRRATQMACFCPIMQWHSEPVGGQFKELMPGGEGNNERSPWNIALAHNDPSFIDEMRYWHNLRMNILPYLYSTALDCVDGLLPMMRPLAYTWPDDKEAVSVEDEYLLGESLLIAPLLIENAKHRKAYLPKGNWVSLFTRCKVKGGSFIDTDIAGSFPVFIRHGSGIALNLDDEKVLGGPVGNRLDTYQNLHFLLAGEQGQYRFRDDLGNDFTIRWRNCEVIADECIPSGITWELL